MSRLPNFRFTKFRSFNLPSNRFADLERELDRIFRVTQWAQFKTLDLDKGYGKPGKPFRGVIQHGKAGSWLLPHFYWDGARLIIAIADARGEFSVDADESLFWSNISEAVTTLGGTPAGFGRPPNLPPEAAAWFD